MQINILKKIKWENIIMLCMIMLFIISMVHHYQLNGFYLQLITMELPVYSSITFIIWYLIKDIRTNPTNWKI